MPIYRIIGKKWTASSKIVQNVEHGKGLRTVLPLLSKKLGIPSMKHYSAFRTDAQRTPDAILDLDAPLEAQGVEASAYIFVAPSDSAPTAPSGAALPSALSPPIAEKGASTAPPAGPPPTTDPPMTAGSTATTHQPTAADDHPDSPPSLPDDSRTKEPTHPPVTSRTESQSTTAPSAAPVETPAPPTTDTATPATDQPAALWTDIVDLVQRSLTTEITKPQVMALHQRYKHLTTAPASKPSAPAADERQQATSSLSERDSAMGELQAQLAAVQAELAASQQRTAELTDERQQATSSLSERDSAMGELQAQLAAVQAELVRVKKELESEQSLTVSLAARVCQTGGHAAVGTGTVPPCSTGASVRSAAVQTRALHCKNCDVLRDDMTLCLGERDAALAALREKLRRADAVNERQLSTMEDLEMAMKALESKKTQLEQDLVLAANHIEDMERDRDAGWKGLQHDDTVNGTIAQPLPLDALAEQVRRLRGLPRIACEVMRVCAKIARDVQVDAEEVASSNDLPNDLVVATGDAFAQILDQLGATASKLTMAVHNLQDAPTMATCVGVLEDACTLDVHVHEAWAALLELERLLHDALPMDEAAVVACLLHIDESVNAIASQRTRAGGKAVASA